MRGSPHPLRGLAVLAAASLFGVRRGRDRGRAAAARVLGAARRESVASASGLLVVDVRWSPDPPAVGLAASELTVTDATGAPVAGLTLTVVPWMPAHGHGSSTMPDVSETAPGVYVATPISFYMPGQWELRTTISAAGAADDMATPSLRLP